MVDDLADMFLFLVHDDRLCALPLEVISEVRISAVEVQEAAEKEAADGAEEPNLSFCEIHAILLSSLFWFLEEDKKTRRS